MKRGAIILAGGQSRRMGQPKASLPFGAYSILQQIVNTVSPLVESCVVVAAEHQPLPPLLLERVRIVQDRRPARGPLEGLYAGLQSLALDTELVFVCSCDVPLLRSDLVLRLFELLQHEDDAVVPRDSEHLHPLVAVYHSRIVSTVERLLNEDQLSLVRLTQEIRTRIITTDSLRTADANLVSFLNVNTEDDYRRALGVAGLRSPGDAER